MAEPQEVTVTVQERAPVYVTGSDGTRTEVGWAEDFDPETGEATVTLFERYVYLFEQDIEFSIFV